MVSWPIRTHRVLTNQNTTDVVTGVACDWWSLGIVLYEMMYGYPPFAAEDPMTTYTNIVNWQRNLDFPPEIAVSKQAQSTIRRLD